MSLKSFLRVEKENRLGDFYLIQGLLCAITTRQCISLYNVTRKIKIFRLSPRLYGLWLTSVQNIAYHKLHTLIAHH